MPKVSTDDQARRLRYIYLGPVGFRFPFDARFPAIGMTLGIAAFLSLLSFAFAPAGTKLDLLGVLLSPIPAIWLTRKAMKHVEHDRPLRWWVTVLAAELNTPRPHPEPTERFVAPAPALFSPKDAA